mmetsp:Transcript_32886/g.74243  ORF Transcript_32886/g.74243 Transcript_32886/m.74243 type:complete len:228 (-) Transcript_32886:465-1148(-)
MLVRTGPGSSTAPGGPALFRATGESREAPFGDSTRAIRALSCAERAAVCATRSETKAPVASSCTEVAAAVAAWAADTASALAWLSWKACRTLDVLRLRSWVILLASVMVRPAQDEPSSRTTSERSIADWTAHGVGRAYFRHRSASLLTKRQERKILEARSQRADRASRTILASLADALAWWALSPLPPLPEETRVRVRIARSKVTSVVSRKRNGSVMKPPAASSDQA